MRAHDEQMGHDDEFRAYFAERCGGKPVLLAQTVVAKVAAELLPPDSSRL